jgi:hypothetical protein
MSTTKCDSRITKFEHIWHNSAQSFTICIVLESTPPLFRQFISSATQHFWHSIQASMHCCISFEIVWVVMIILPAFSAFTKEALSTFRRRPGKDIEILQAATRIVVLE